MAKKPSVAIIGCGRLGGALGLALQRRGYTIAAASSASAGGTQRAARLLDCKVTNDPAEAAKSAEIVLVAVPDDAIVEVASVLSAVTSPSMIVVHTSGATSVEALASVASTGARTASMHPLQSIADPRRGAEALKGAAVAVTSAPDDRSELYKLAYAWGGRPFPLPDESKTLYHAAAVMASNYVAASIAAALAVLEATGLENTRALLGPLVRTSASNAVATRAVTGPAVRGDAGTVRAHLEALRDVDTDPDVIEAYRVLAVLAARIGGGDPEAIRGAMV